MKSGFIALTGRPNVGKSTLINKIVKEKVAIVSNKPQTTRDRIKGILTLNNTQYVFIDTPGIHKPKHLLGESMTNSAIGTLREVDIVMMILDGTEPIGTGDKYVYDRIIESGAEITIAIINKIDKLSDDDIINKKIEIENELGEFNEILCLSAEYGINIVEMLKKVEKYMEEGVMYYPEDMYTDMPMYKMITEIIREKIIWHTEEEIPHSVAIEISHVEKHKDAKDRFDINIYVERDSQKGIIIGKEGKLLKKIGTESRKEIEFLLERKIYLNLWVKVKEKWRTQKPFLKDLGYIFEE
ncbi:MAG: GTPase Era [Fusobacteria bacterium]|nr:GTPase Era [Fusobacteriota bacterium]